MTTNARSVTPLPPPPNGWYDEGTCHDQEREEADRLPARERARQIAQLELLGARSHRDRQERVVATQDLSRPAIDAHPPIEIPVFPDEHVARIARRWLELDAHFPRVPRSHAGARSRRGWQPAERRWGDGRVGGEHDDPTVSREPGIRERWRNERIGIEFDRHRDHAGVGGCGISLVQISASASSSFYGAHHTMIARHGQRIRDNYETRSDQIPKFRRAEEITPFVATAEQLVVITELVSLVTNHLGNTVRHQHVLGIGRVPWIDIEIEHSVRLWFRAKARHNRVGTVEALVRWIGIEPEPAPVAPQIDTHEQRQSNRQRQCRHSSLQVRERQ